MKRGIVSAAVAYALWGLLPVYWKWLREVPAVEVLSHRILWSFLTLLAVILATARFGDLKRSAGDRRVLGTYTAAALLIGVNWLIYIWAVGAGFIVETSLGYFINPLLSVLLGVVFFRERLRPWQTLSIALAASGVLYLTLAYGALPWIALSLAVTFSLYGLVKKTAPLGSLEGLTLETGTLLLPAVAFLAYADVNGSGAFPGAGPMTCALLAGTGLVTMVPLLLFSSAARRIPLSLVGILQYIAPTLQFLIGVLVYREPFDLTKLVGFGIVWLALIIYAAESFIDHRAHFLPASQE
ncbi:MAG TPA: EamA family transporter RarD [Deltaproteobacteria bacterium]|nr:EamA family transporter RarD [Deltaproteobacteria bacterium]HOI06160.1 EamA family transporter RarD [Deltaproteobacteria bacterium]